MSLFTSAFFFTVRSVYGTILLHNFLGLFGVLNALARGGRLAGLQQAALPLVATAVGTLGSPADTASCMALSGYCTSNQQHGYGDQVMTGEIQGLYAYNMWANHRFLDATAGLSSEEFDRDLRSSFPSVKATLTHILEAEWIWLERWHGVSPTEVPPWDTSTHAALRAQWQLIEQHQLAYAGTLTDERLQGVIDYRSFASQPFSQPLWQLMRHVVNHSTFHRGQVATMLRQLGHAVPVSDLVAYYRQL